MKNIVEALNKFYINEYGSDEAIDKIPEDGIIPLAYTSYFFGDGIEREIQVSFDMKNIKYLNYIDGKVVLEEPRKSIEDFIEEIDGCTFSSIISDCIDKGIELYGEE